MQNYRFLKKLIDSGQDVFTLDELKHYNSLNNDEFKNSLTYLEKKHYIIKEKDYYIISEKARIEFANEFSKRTLVLLLSVSILITLILFVMSRLK